MNVTQSGAGTSELYYYNQVGFSFISKTYFERVVLGNLRHKNTSRHLRTN